MRIKIQNRALLKISGDDAESFLQAQLTNDISLIGNNKIQLSAFCQHQGKIIALFWLMRSERSFLISFPEDLTEKVISRLRMFILISDVIIEDISEHYAQIGLVNEASSSAYIINESLSLLIESSRNKDNEVDSNYEGVDKSFY
jgi:folate-binding Fe-S cluster repair protein YgfZ